MAEFDPRMVAERVAEEASLILTDDQAQKLAKFASLLLKWNKVYNLTSIKEPEEVVRLHLIDSLLLVEKFEEAGRGARKVLDVGSGGGLPAVPLAIMRPDIEVTMVDSVQKKVIFLRQAIAACRLMKNARAIHVRVEQITDQKFEVITSRAFASLEDMVNLTKGALASNGLWLAMKAKVPEEEIAKLPEGVCVEKVVQLGRENSEFERHLIILKPWGLEKKFEGV